MRPLERHLLRYDWHLALAGGVMVKGWSTHDLDVVFYPRSSTRASVEHFRRGLRTFGDFQQTHTVADVHALWRRKGFVDEKHVEVWTYRDRRIDFIRG